MDGVDQLNNVLIIGMTNRMDMIDEALLRPGRLEVHIEISLPDEHGRLQILNIHTSKMKNNGVMANDVDLAELASLTKNFSGAEIGGLVKSATSFAFNRHVKVSLDRNGTLAHLDTGWLRRSLRGHRQYQDFASRLYACAGRGPSRIWCFGRGTAASGAEWDHTLLSAGQRRSLKLLLIKADGFAGDLKGWKLVGRASPELGSYATSLRLIAW